MSNDLHMGAVPISLTSARDIGIPARILDLLTAHGHVPRSFAFHAEFDGLRLRIVTGVMPGGRRAILVAKMRCISGVRSLTEGEPLPACRP